MGSINCSVIINCWNKEAYLDDCIFRLLGKAFVVSPYIMGSTHSENMGFFTTEAPYSNMFFRTTLFIMAILQECKKGFINKISVFRRIAIISPSLFRMITSVVFLTYQGKIFNSIVQWVMVYVMDFFSRKKSSAKMFFHDISMKKDFFAMFVRKEFHISSKIKIWNSLSKTSPVWIVVSRAMSSPSSIVHTAISLYRFCFKTLNNGTFHNMIISQPEYNYNNFFKEGLWEL